MPIFDNEVNRMGNCKHMFVGTAEGIHCTRCGLLLSPAEYARLLHPEGPEPPEPEKPAPRRGGRKRGDAK